MVKNPLWHLPSRGYFSTLQIWIGLGTCSEQKNVTLQLPRKALRGLLLSPPGMLWGAPHVRKPIQSTGGWWLLCRGTQVPQPTASTNCHTCEWGCRGRLGPAESLDGYKWIRETRRKSKQLVQAKLPHRMVSKQAAKFWGGAAWIHHNLSG